MLKVIISLGNDNAFLNYPTLTTLNYLINPLRKKHQKYLFFNRSEFAKRGTSYYRNFPQLNTSLFTQNNLFLKKNLNDYFFIN